MKKIGDVKLCCTNCWYSNPAINKETQLECHIRPPEIKEAEQMDGTVLNYSVWPAVADNMWCGEWEDAKATISAQLAKSIFSTG